MLEVVKIIEGSLSYHTSQNYERILERRVRFVVEPLVGEEQHGYRTNRAVTDLMVIEKAWGYKSIYSIHRSSKGL